MRKASKPKRPNGSLRAAIGLFVWFIAMGIVMLVAASDLYKGTSPLSVFVGLFVAICLFSALIFRGPAKKENATVVEAFSKVMRWQLAVTSLFAALGVSIILTKEESTVLRAMGENIGSAWELLVVMGLAAGFGLVMTLNYMSSLDEAKSAEGREELAAAIGREVAAAHAAPPAKKSFLRFLGSTIITLAMLRWVGSTRRLPSRDARR